MSEEQPDSTKPTASTGRLPALTAKRHSASPFRPVVSDPVDPRELTDQVRDDPAAATAAPPPPATQTDSELVPETVSRSRGRGSRPAPRGRSAAKEEPETDLVRLQTLVPFETQLAFKMHCARNRTTINDELRRLLERFLVKQS